MKITPRGMSKLKIPKLELLALLLGCRLAKTLKELIEPREIVMWTDSKVTLAWVASPDAKDHKNIFISNQVAEIVFLQQVCRFSLNHVPSKQNPADVLSRGATTQQLLDNSLWRNGPEFLRTTGKPVPYKEDDPTHENTVVAAVQELREEMSPVPPGEIWEILQREVEFQFLLRVTRPPPPPLPKERITLTKPFTAVAVDHTAAIQTETRPGYILIVTCMASRAVYLDFCPSLEAEEFVVALRQFCATHGAPSLITSDNHQTFKTASNLLQGLYEEDEVQQFLRRRGIHWRFQMPGAPWKGGFFERLIGVTKRTLQIALGKKYLPDTHVITLVKEAEAVVNNRPLMYSGDKCEDEVLTPSHLLRGHPVHLTAPILPEDHLNATFTSQRLPTWPLGRVVETYPDDDGVVRSAKVLFEGVESLRAISHLVPQEIAPSEDGVGEDDDDDGEEGAYSLPAGMPGIVETSGDNQEMAQATTSQQPATETFDNDANSENNTVSEASESETGSKQTDAQGRSARPLRKAAAKQRELLDRLLRSDDI
ncbi:uncharacterized protein [Palaemon carinicauda]|uniref:uncharacterized protein n=1 Tax=Palaemon carinicauda TaxID=392227 RepID=UPI0035B67E0E